MDEDGNESVVTITYKIKFIDSARFMATSLSNLVNNLTEEIHKIKRKNYDYFIECGSVKENRIKYKRTYCDKNYLNKVDEEFKKIFKNIFKFSNNGINKTILLLRKGVYLYEYMDEWEKLNGASLPEKEEFYSNLNMQDITNADYMHEKIVCKDFEIKNVGKYHDLYLKSDTLLLADVF